MMSKKMIKVICIIMAALMILSAFAVVLQVFAVGDSAVVASTVTPNTGEGDAIYIIPAAVAVIAILAVVICLVLPKMKNAEGEEAKEDTGVSKKEKPEKKTEVKKPLIKKTDKKSE